ncbi:MAG: tetratricopeptide repeat protein [Candidatus Cloacimonas sp.]|nr:tetratricopeptide repeat protein [Candidatus Cloacimonadota bacterium]
MRKRYLVLILVMGVVSLFSGEIDDFRFIIGLYKDGHNQLAMTEIDGFLNDYPNSEYINNVRFLKANILMAEENYLKGAKAFKELEKEGVDPIIRPDIYLGLAQCFFFTDNFAESEKYLSRFTKEFKNHRLLPKAYYFLGRIAYQKVEYSKALTFLNQVDEDSQDWSYRVAKIQTLVALDMNDEAKSILDQYVEQKEHSELLHQALIIYFNHLLKAKQYQHVVTYAVDFIPYDSVFYDNYLAIMGEANYELGNYRAALERFDALGETSERSEYFTALCFLKLDEDLTAEKLFSQLSENAKNEEIKTNSYFFLATIKGKKDFREANKMLESFVSQNPDHPFVGSAYYQLGMNWLFQNIYDEAVESFKNALDTELSDEFNEKAKYLLAESLFQLKNIEEAYLHYVEYEKLYPKGEFLDETLFKIGLYHFEKEDFANALVKFDRIISEHPESDRLSMAYFYKAEIFTLSRQDDLALTLYEKAADRFENRGLVAIRIAQVNFKLGKYDEAMDELEQIPSSSEYVYEKMIIQGNIYYAKKNYLSAIKIFAQATELAESDVEWEDSTLRQARTLYQLKEYREASRLYKQLYEKTRQQQYLLNSATVAFTADEFRNAIEMFQQYINYYPESPDIYQAKLHLADSYYNSKDYNSAVQRYRELIRPDVDPAILTNSLNGLEWSTALSEQYDFIKELNKIVLSEDEHDFNELILRRKIDYYYSQSRWEEVVYNVEKLLELELTYNTEREYKKMLGISLLNRKQYRDAEDVFEELIERQPDASVLVAWSRLHLAENDKEAALLKLKEACSLTEESQTWLDMLTLSVSLKDEEFSSLYAKFRGFARGVDLEQGELLQIRWYLLNEVFDSVSPLINNLLSSKYEPIKAKAQYYKGVHLYKIGRTDEAIKELLRVRYLYPRVEDVRIEAEILVIEAYAETGNLTEAKKIYDSIRNDLKPEQRREIARKIGLEG